MDPATQLLEYQRELFNRLEEFFQRATGRTPSKFCHIDDFAATVRRDAHSIATRAAAAYPWADQEIRRFYAEKGAHAFQWAKELGGLKLVLGGSSRFLGTHFEAVKRTALYADTILIPDPVLPWLESPREEERFRHVSFLQAVFMLLHLKPLVDADLPFPAIAVFPSWEKMLEENDQQTQKATFQLVADVAANYVHPEIRSIEGLAEYVKQNPDAFIQAVEKHRLFVAPGGHTNEPLHLAIHRYKDEMETWRSKKWLEQVNSLSDVGLVLNGIIERISPQYHLLENSEELHASPMLCIEQQAHYFRIVGKTNGERLRQLGLLDRKTQLAVETLGSRQLNWLSNIPLDALCGLRRNNENSAFRTRVSKAIATLHDASLDDLGRVAAEVCHEVTGLVAEHDKHLREIQSKYARIHGQTAVAAWAAVGAALIPSLAPFVGTAAPLALAGKYVWDKVAEQSDRRRLSRSLMGVLSAAKRDQS